MIAQVLVLTIWDVGSNLVHMQSEKQVCIFLININL